MATGKPLTNTISAKSTIPERRHPTLIPKPDYGDYKFALVVVSDGRALGYVHSTYRFPHFELFADFNPADDAARSAYDAGARSATVYRLSECGDWLFMTGYAS